MIDVNILPNMNHSHDLAKTLKACPKCGGEKIETGGKSMWEWWEEFIECKKCLFSLSSGTAPYRDIVEKWNNYTKPTNR